MSDAPMRFDGATGQMVPFTQPEIAQRAIDAASAAPKPVALAAISDRQFAQILAMRGVITQDEALSWAARGDLPDMLADAVAQLPAEAQFAARMLLSSATAYERRHPLVEQLGAILINPATGQAFDAAALDDLWRVGGTL